MVGDVKHIVIIESLENETLTGKELYEDCVRRRIDLLEKPLTHKYHMVKNIAQLTELLRYFEVNGEYLKDGLLIHFEMHGNQNDGLLLVDGSWIGWEDLINTLRPINVATGGRLYLTMATCYGRYIYFGIDSSKKAPFSGYISASMEVNTEEITENFGNLFEHTIETGNVVTAFLAIEDRATKFYYKDLETCFEDAFDSVRKKFNDPAFKREFLRGCTDQVKSRGEEIPDAEWYEIIFQKALKDNYVQHKAAYMFNDKVVD